MLGCALTLTSCAGADQQGSPAHRMSVWVSGTGFGAEIGTLIADNARIPKDVANGTGAVHAACSTMVNDAADGQRRAAVARPRRDRAPQQAYGLEQSAANDCYNAGTTDTKLLSKAAARRDQGRGALQPGAPADPRDRRQAGPDHDDHRQLDGRHLRMSAAGTPDEELDRHRRRVLWALPTGLYLVGSRAGDEVNLMTANLVVQVCIEPEAGRRGARARLGDGTAGHGGRLPSPSRCSSGPTATWCGAS